MALSSDRIEIYIFSPIIESMFEILRYHQMASTCTYFHLYNTLAGQQMALSTHRLDMYTLSSIWYTRRATDGVINIRPRHVHFFPRGSIAPSGPRPPPHCHNDSRSQSRQATFDSTPLDVWSARRRDLYLTTHNSQETDIHAPGKIRNRNPNKRAAADRRLRPHGHCNRLDMWIL